MAKVHLLYNSKTYAYAITDVATQLRLQAADAGFTYFFSGRLARVAQRRLQLETAVVRHSRGNLHIFSKLQMHCTGEGK